MKLSTNQLNFYNTHQPIRRDAANLKISSKSFEKYRKGLRVPSPKTLSRFGETGKLVEVWKNHDFWHLLGDRPFNLERVLHAIKKPFKRPILHEDQLITQTRLMNLFPYYCDSRYLWRKGSLEALTALLGFLSLAKQYEDDFWYAKLSHGAFYLMIDKLQEKQFCRSKNDIFQLACRHIFYETPKHHVQLYRLEENLDQLQNRINESIRELQKLGAWIYTDRQRATAIFRFWAEGYAFQGKSEFHNLSKREKSRFYRKWYLKRPESNVKPIREMYGESHGYLDLALSKPEKESDNPFTEADDIQVLQYVVKHATEPIPKSLRDNFSAIHYQHHGP